MRSCRWYCVALMVLAICLCALGCAKQRQSVGAGTSKPRLQRIVLYTWGLDTGGTSVDVSKDTLEGFPRHLTLNEDQTKVLGELGPSDIYFVKAKVDRTDIRDLESLVKTSGLRDFEPRDSDIADREPMVDECPPTLVLIWSDRTQVLSLPLSGTVKPGIAADRANCYQAMENITDRMRNLGDKYGRPPHVSIISVKGQEYEAFERERDKLMD